MPTDESVVAKTARTSLSPQADDFFLFSERLLSRIGNPRAHHSSDTGEWKSYRKLSLVYQRSSTGLDQPVLAIRFRFVGNNKATHRVDVEIRLHKYALFIRLFPCQ